jgi:hypothetical protein
MGIKAPHVRKGTRLLPMQIQRFNPQMLSTDIPQEILNMMPKVRLSRQTCTTLRMRQAFGWVERQNKKRIGRVHLLKPRRIYATRVKADVMIVRMLPNYKRRDRRLEIV